MSTDNFGITLIEQLKKSYDRCRHQSPDTVREEDVILIMKREKLFKISFNVL